MAQDIYVRYADGRESGPHPESWLDAEAGAFSPGDLVARVPRTSRPREGDYAPAPLARPVAAAGTSAPDDPGTYLRMLGVLIVAAGAVGAFVAAWGPASTSGSSDASAAVFAAVLVESVVYGALVWAAGAVLRGLAEIRDAI